MNLRTSALLLFLILTLESTFAQTRWKLASSNVSFSIKNAGFSVNGTLGAMKADLIFYPENLAASTISASLDANTVNTGVQLRDKHLKKPEYLDVAQYPNIQIKSVSFSKNNAEGFTGIFLLTIKKTTKQITIPFSYSKSGQTAQFSAKFILNRRDFEVGGSSWTMADEVAIMVQLIANK